jgi:hypothetical protein
MLLSHRQNAGKNHDKKIVNRSFQNMTELKHLETKAINQKSIQNEINNNKNNLGIARYHSACCLKN